MSTAYCEIDLPGVDPSLPGKAAFRHPQTVLAAYRPAEVVPLLRQVAQLAESGLWVVGFVAYEAAAAFDPSFPEFGCASDMPLALFAAFSEQDQPRQRTAGMWGCWRDITANEHCGTAIDSILDGIRQGQFYQVNYTTRLRASWHGDSAVLFDALRDAQPGAYSVFLDFDRWHICSVSPELFFHWQPGADSALPRLTMRPMKGTAPREADFGLDQQAKANLRTSAKETAENLMIVDLLRNDASRIATLGSVKVESLFEVEQWATVWQMTSSICCQARPGISLPDIFGALFPCGSVTGAPKRAAMQAIARLETEPRGVYCGAIGFVKPGGEALFNVGIRTVVIDSRTNRAECGVGSGIVADSGVVQEQNEWRAKRRFLDAACPQYALFETLLLREGRYWLLEQHMQRLERSARLLGFEFDRAEAIERLACEASRRASGCWRVRLTLDISGSLALTTSPRGELPATAQVAWAPGAIRSDNPWLGHKTTRRQLYDELAMADVFDTLLFNERREVTEFTRGNLVARFDRKLLTPALESGLLPGTFRAALIERGAVREARLSIDDVLNADRLWFINSVRGSIPVVLNRKMPQPNTQTG